MAALAKSSMVFFMAMALVGVCFGAVYKVGDSHGWTDQGHFNYKTWSSNKHFTVGDTLVFEYDAKKENLVQVDHKGYKECEAKDSLFSFASGNDNVKITMPGDFFYISSIHDHCNAGQKLHIQVHASSSTPSPSQTPSFSTPSPSPVHLSPSPTPVTSIPSASPSLSPNGYAMPSPSGLPNYNPNRSPSTITRSPPNPSPKVRPNPPTVRPNPPKVRPNPPPSLPIVVSNPPPSVPIVVSNPPPSPGGTPPRRRKAVITKSQAPPSNGLPILQVLMAVAVVVYIA
ncbi:blue copper protein-like [Prunus avium]|uniref:Blue copper protein-like n=1 Tax=Prunus avium TaxID=42229 RepID=A0A6P5RLG8_PRUAV|nr:blue copper protein-like [Prunus avium]